MAEIKTINLPDVGDFDEIEIIEILIAPKDEIQAEDSIIVLESDKATMEIPSPYAGNIQAIMVKVGDRIAEGTPIATIEVAGASNGAEPPVTNVEKPAEVEAPVVETQKPVASEPPPARAGKPAPALIPASGADRSGNLIHASPSIRRYARELGVTLDQVIGSGAKGRIMKEDVKAFIKTALSSDARPSGGGVTVSAMPEIDFSKFGEVEVKELSRIKKISGAHLHRSWVNVPHVTQFDEADITDLEAFRKSLAKEAEKRGVRLTPLVFMMKAVASALKAFPDFNASLENTGERLILKKYINIGVAVDTPNGLMVPVIRDVDKKGLFDLA